MGEGDDKEKKRIREERKKWENRKKIENYT